MSIYSQHTFIDLFLVCARACLKTYVNFMSPRVPSQSPGTCPLPFTWNRVRRRLKQSAMLRARARLRVGEASIAIGEYVLLSGTVASGDVLVSPGKNVQCVRFVRRTVSSCRPQRRK